MNNEHCVIIGGSHAAASLSANLRTAGWEGKITIVSSENIAPYHRPPLSKDYLSGVKTAEDLLIRPPSFYEKKDIDLLLGRWATKLDRSNKTVKLDDGSTLTYTKLALVTGAKVRKLNMPGCDLPGVGYLRDLTDVDSMETFMGKGKAAVIIGGGYIGLETASALRKAGMEVTVLEAMPRLLQRVTGPEISAFYERIHTEEGVNIITEAAATSIDGTNKVESVSLADGTKIPADLVVIGIGILPETDLAEAAGIEVGNGIIVDEYARTNDHDIVAAGDCAFHHNPIYDMDLRLESVQNASDQAKVAANTLCGKLEPYRALPWFWSDQFDLKLQIAGLSQGFDKIVVRGTLETGRSFSAFYFKEGRLLAVDSVNAPKEFMTTRRMLTQGKNADPAKLKDLSVDIAEAFEQ